MPQFEPSSIDDILNGTSADTSQGPDADSSTGQTPAPETDETPIYETEQSPDQPPSEYLPITEGLERVEENVKSIKDSSDKIAGEVREMHKLYHNEFAGRLKSMQDELERYREIEKGRAFDGILNEVAKLYSDYESVLDDITDIKAKKKVNYLLMDILQILEANGVYKQKSGIGDKRNTRYCQVIERIETDDPQLHDTIALSRSTGFYIENRALIKELVDIYLYSENSDEH
jgi:hypothetical protein